MEEGKGFVFLGQGYKLVDIKWISECDFILCQNGGYWKIIGKLEENERLKIILKSKWEIKKDQNK